jgi:hypothetical protein
MQDLPHFLVLNQKMPRVKLKENMIIKSKTVDRRKIFA